MFFTRKCSHNNGRVLQLTISLTLLLSLAFPASALQGNECAQRAKRIAEDKREDFIVRCLERAQSPANVKAETRRQKQQRCEQNAKNQHLKGKKKSRYLSMCLNKNEAAVAAKRKPDNNIPLSEIPFLNEITSSNLNKKDGHKKGTVTRQPPSSRPSYEPSITDLFPRQK